MPSALFSLGNRTGITLVSLVITIYGEGAWHCGQLCALHVQDIQSPASHSKRDSGSRDCEGPFPAEDSAGSQSQQCSAKQTILLSIRQLHIY